MQLDPVHSMYGSIFVSSLIWPVARFRFQSRTLIIVDQDQRDVDFRLIINPLNYFHKWHDFHFKSYMARFCPRPFLDQKYKHIWNKENRKERKDRLLSYKINPLGVEQHGDNPCISPYGPRQVRIKLRRTLKDLTGTYPQVCVLNYGPSMNGQTIIKTLHGETPSRSILCLNNISLLLWVSPSLGKQEREYSQENRCNMQHATCNR